MQRLRRPRTQLSRAGVPATKTTKGSSHMKTAAIDTDTPQRLAISLTRVGQVLSRYGLVVVLAWIGFGKYVKMDSRVLIEHSPLMSWIYDVLSVNTVAKGLGTME